MTTKKEVETFVRSQKSIQFYKKVQVALKDVLLKMPLSDFKKVKNTELMVLHEGALAQVMHFSKKSKFQIIQITFPKKIPINVLRFVIAHEFGHVLQGRNWKKSDGSKLETDADNYAEKIGFKRTKQIHSWIVKNRK